MIADSIQSAAAAQASAVLTLKEHCLGPDLGIHSGVGEHRCAQDRASNRLHGSGVDEMTHLASSGLPTSLRNGAGSKTSDAQRDPGGDVAPRVHDRDCGA